MAKKKQGNGILLPFTHEEYAHNDNPDDKDIELATRMGHHIPNCQRHEGLTPLVTRQVRDIENAWPLAERRAPPNPIYNCHGMTFASRRTKIIEDAVVLKILKEDGYDKVVPPNKIKPGDVILYFSPTGGVEHSGVVIEVDDQNDPWVLSKWGYCAEYRHRAYHCGYPKSNIEYHRMA